MHSGKDKARGQAGFSLIELLIAMMVMMLITAAASTLLVSSFNVRAREDQRSDALADAQRAMNILTRELANAGYKVPRGLTYQNAAGANVLVPRNGLLPADCDAQSVAFVANLNAMDGGVGSGSVNETNEAVKYQMFSDPAQGNFIVRNDFSTGNTEVLANRVDGMMVTYFDAAGNDTSADKTRAVAVRVQVWVNLRQMGTPGSPGYQPARQVLLDSSIELRNSNPNINF
ncbi:MAG: type II secretion system protein J [Pyrinomonadaceae bacterium]